MIKEEMKEKVNKQVKETKKVISKVEEKGINQTIINGMNINLRKFEIGSAISNSKKLIPIDIFTIEHETTKSNIYITANIVDNDTSVLVFDKDIFLKNITNIKNKTVNEKGQIVEGENAKKSK